MVERYTRRGLLAERYFPEAHGIGLRIRYEDYREKGDEFVAHKTTLSWGKSSNSMVILVVGYEIWTRNIPDSLNELQSAQGEEPGKK